MNAKELREWLNSFNDKDNLYFSWPEMNMREKQRALGMITSEEATEFSKNSVRLGMIKPEEAIELTENLMRFGKAVQGQAEI